MELIRSRTRRARRSLVSDARDRATEPECLYVGDSSESLARGRGPWFAVLCCTLMLGAAGCKRGALDAGWNHAPIPSSDSTSLAGREAFAEPTLANLGGASSSAVDRLDAGASPSRPDASSTADAGSPEPASSLPVGRENPVILLNDGPLDSWYGEYAVLFAHAEGPKIAGIVVGVGRTWPDLDANLGGWRDLVTRAHESGLTEVPEPVGSTSAPLQRPNDGNIDSTLPNGSEGARFIVEKSLELSQPDRPVVVATGGALTDVADAYLLDPTVAERIVVVSSLGSGFAEATTVAQMGIPNGEMDTWADAIVIGRLRYIQVSAFYDQSQDVPAERAPELPANPLGEWMRDKRDDIWPNPVAADQVSILVLALPEFTSAVERVSQQGFIDGQPTLTRDPEGNALLVTAIDATVARSRLWALLTDPVTF